MYILDTLVTTNDEAADYARPRWAAIKASAEVIGPDAELAAMIDDWLASGIDCGDLRQDESHYDTLAEAIEAGDMVKKALDMGLMPGHALLSMVVVEWGLVEDIVVHTW